MQRPCMLVAVVVLGLLVYRQAISVWQGRGMENASQVNTIPVFRSAPAESSRLKVLDTYGRLPLHFEANQGQTDEQVQFLARGNGYSLFLTGTEAVWVLPKPEATAQTQQPDSRLLSRSDWGRGSGESDPAASAAALRIKLVGANLTSKGRGLEELPGKVHYFIGNDATKWRSNIPTYAKVQFREVWMGVDIVYYGNQRELEFDFVVRPGADLGAIGIAFEGVDGVQIDAQGDLILKAPGGELRLRKPVVYQDVAGVRREVASCYVLIGPRQVGFQVAAYDLSSELVIDPVLVYSTYLGGKGTDFGFGITADAAGNAYVIGSTGSTDFPTLNPLQPLRSLSDAFVTKLDPTGSALIYSTYLGGSDLDYGGSIAVDAAGNAYVTGYTYSTDFPTVHPLQPGLGNDCSPFPCPDAFVTKLDHTGSALVYSTYLGGSGNDLGFGITVDAAGNAYVTGWTGSTDFPTVNPLQPTFGGGICGLPGQTYTCPDAFVAKISSAGSALVYSTYLGGSNYDVGSGIAVDAAGNAYVTGLTRSADFPAIDPLQPSLGGGVCFGEPCSDAFIAKLNPTGSALVYSTYLGGSGDDGGSKIAVDAADNAYVTGMTESLNFPSTPGAFQPVHRGYTDAFVTKLNATGSVLVYSTYLGGSGGDKGFGIAVDRTGHTYVTGMTTSSDFPTTPGAFQLGYGGGFEDAFVVRLNPAGSVLAYSSYLGGDGSEHGTAIAIDAAGNGYVTGLAAFGFPTTPGAFQRNFGQGFMDAFVTKIHLVTKPELALEVNQPAFRPGEQLILTAIILPGPQVVTADVYIAIRLPNGALLFWQGEGNFTPAIQPIVRDWLISPFNEEICTYTFDGTEPAGSYTWLGVFTEPGTLNIIGGIAQAPFTFSP